MLVYLKPKYESSKPSTHYSYWYRLVDYDCIVLDCYDNERLFSMFASQRTIDAIALIYSAQQSATTDLCHWCGDNSICHDDDDDDDDRLVAQSCCPFHIDSFTHLISFCVFVLYLLLYMITMVR